MTASFLSPLPREGSQPSTGTRSTSSHLQPDATPRQTETNLDFPPVTPMPQPAVKDGDEQYAAAEGQVVWEGQITDKYQIYKGDQGWVAVWKSEVKIGESPFRHRADFVEYMRTNIRDPVLALTASVTLRDAPVKPGHKRGNFSIDTISTRTGGDDYDEEEADYGGDGLARMNQFDLLGGLVEGKSHPICTGSSLIEQTPVVYLLLAWDRGSGRICRLPRPLHELFLRCQVKLRPKHPLRLGLLEIARSLTHRLRLPFENPIAEY